MAAKPPIHVTVTGAAGQIGYSLLFRIASGQLLGPDQPVVLRLLEIEPGMKALEGVVMEIDDCAFPLVSDIVTTTDLDTAFDGTSGPCWWARSPARRGWSGAISSPSTAGSSDLRAGPSPPTPPPMCGSWWWATRATPTA